MKVAELFESTIDLEGLSKALFNFQKSKDIQASVSNISKERLRFT